MCSFLARPPISHLLNGQSGKKRARRQEGSNRAGGNKHGTRGVMRELALTCQGRVAIPYNCIAPATMPYNSVQCHTMPCQSSMRALQCSPICRWPVAHNCFNCLSKDVWGVGNVTVGSKNFNQGIFLALPWCFSASQNILICQLCKFGTQQSFEIKAHF